MVKKNTAKKSQKTTQKKRIAIFIDGNNFRHGIKALIGGESINWKMFLKDITKNHQLIYANYYVGKMTSPLFDEKKVKKQSKLFRALDKAQFNIWQGYFNEDKHEKGVDVQIALDLVIGAIEDHYDMAMLISGDGDLSNAVRLVEHYKKKVVLGYVAGTKSGKYRISWRLKSVSSSSAALNAQIQQAEIQTKKNAEKKKKTKTAKASSSKKKTPQKSETLLLFADGGSRGNPGPAGCGALLCREDGTVVKKISEYIGETTNNQAEYQALLFGLKEAAKLKPKELRIYMDSKLVVEQSKGNWKVKKAELRPHQEKIQAFLKKHPNTSFHHIPREKNGDADALANQAMDRKK